MFAFTFFIGFLAIFLLALYERYNRSGRLIRKIPGPKSWPIVGSTLQYALPSDKFFPFLRSLQKDYGYINQVHGFNIRMVNIANPEDFEKILTSTDLNVKKEPYRFVMPWLSSGLLVASGKKWHQRRKMLTKAFHFTVLKKYLEVFKVGTEDFLKRVEKEAEKDQTDVLALVSPTALRTMCGTAMGLSVSEDSPAINKYFHSILAIGECFAERMSKSWLYNDFLFNLSSIASTQKRILADLHEFTRSVIKKRREETPNSGSNDGSEKLAMLDLLLENEKAGLIDDAGIREEVDTFMFAGFDTTSITKTFMIMAIANEPEIQDKLYEEMQMIFGDSQRMPTMDDLAEMKYLECCIKETLRMYPPAITIAREITTDTVLSGYTVPADTTCYMLIYDLHHRADLYPDPERFDPDRFLTENSLNRHPYAYVPFSAGIRNCIGQKFAMLELKVAMSGLLRKFRLEPVTRPSEIQYKFDMVLRTTDPILVRFRTRK